MDKTVHAMENSLHGMEFEYMAWTSIFLHAMDTIVGGTCHGPVLSMPWTGILHAMDLAYECVHGME